MHIRQIIWLICLSFPAFAQTAESILPANPHADVTNGAIAQVENNGSINVVVSDGKRAVRGLAQ